MSLHRTIISAAICAAVSPIAAFAQSSTGTVIVSANPLGKEESMQILSPTKVLSGSELRLKIGSSLGETLGNELGVSASAFGAGASRPIIRGMEGPRVKVLQNGMTVADVSGLSNDHAVASETASSQQIEILRGPAALLYGSGAIGGLVNVVDGRIPTSLSPQINGEAEIKYANVNTEKSASFFLDGSTNDLAWHLDGNSRKTIDYKIPGFANVHGEGDVKGRLPNSHTRENSIGLGVSLIKNWGHVGASVQNMSDTYGIPTEEMSFIDLHQTRYDVDALVSKPLIGFDTFKFKLGSTDYKHTEKLQDGTPATDFKNRTLETRASLQHGNWAGWEGSIGIQTENSNFSALSAETGRADTVPTTRSVSNAIFLVEQKNFGAWSLSAGGRIENVKRAPELSFNLPERQFDLHSFSIGALLPLVDDYSIVSSLSTAQRAPTTEELYSNGPHESTLTFDIGNHQLRREKSRNFELSMQKTKGPITWKINAFINKVDNYVFGEIDGLRVNEEGEHDEEGEFTQRFWKQAAATIRGGEAEIALNQFGEGFSLRGFADTSRGTLEQRGNLPLQAANRVGFDVGFKNGAWRNSLNVLHSQKQDRLAASESYVTPAFTKVDLNITYTHAYMDAQLTWFAQVKNLLNQEIRLATSVLKETVPQPMRGLVIGVRANF